MPRTFLPALRPGQGYVLPQNQSSQFVAGPANVFDDIHEKMAVAEANSEGRAPSPFARVWQFRRNLAGAAGQKEQVRAVEAFRGLLAFFALREYYHLELTVDVSPALASSHGEEETPVSKLFAVHASYLPQSGDAMQARFAFDRRLVFFRLAEPAGHAETVVAGYSPLTLVYPAARSLEHSLALKAVFWYDRDGRRWRDPTNLPDTAHQRLSVESRAHLAAWLDAILAARASDSHRLAILESANLAAADDRFLTELLTAWRKELKTLSVKPAGTIIDSALVKSPTLRDAERSQGGQGFPVPALLGKVCRADARPSDSPTRGDALVLTLEQAARPNHRVYGNIFGSPALADRLAGQAAEGDDLGAALDRPGEAPVPYVLLDALFTPYLGRLRKGSANLGSCWSALTMRDQSNLRGVYLLPFAPAILRYFSAQELRQGTSTEDNIAALQVVFRHDASGLEVRRNYRQEGTPQAEIYGLDDSLDLRFFPDFRLDTLADLDKQMPFLEDRRYYARMRLSPDLDGLSKRWLAKDGSPLEGVAVRYGDGNSFEQPNQNLLAPGKQAFWHLPITTPPGAFEVEGYGLLLLTLRGDAGQPGRQAKSWIVAMDFGTTNSCVAVDKGTGEAESAYRLPIFTSTFLTNWQTGLRGKSDEGYSAMADFMFWQNAEVDVLNRDDFFPTQILTTHPLHLAALAPGKGFNENNGLAFFPNVSLAAVEYSNFPDLINGFEQMGGRADLAPRFNLKRNLKWKDGSAPGEGSFLWRKVFHQHLRLHLVLAAANENAYVERLVASYPRAFTPEDASRYREALEIVWGSPSKAPTHADIRRSHTTVELRSESAAAAVALGVTPGQEFFLLDMGGGTTDIAVFKDNVLEEECSLTLAGQALENYVCHSEKLRRQIAGQFDDEMKKWSEAFTRPKQAVSIYQTLFQGFLMRQHGPRLLAELRTRGRADTATQGFFLTGIFLYTALAYFCGLWLARRRQEDRGITAEERLQWLGNGSAFIHMFRVGDRSFEDVLVRMFNAACDGAAKVSPMRDDAKTVVAKGLLRPSAARAGGEVPQVFSRLLSDSVTFADHPWTPDEALVDFYQRFNGDSLFWDGLSEGRIFRRYLEALQRELPRANFSQGQLVSTAALGIRDPQQWAVEYVATRRGEIEKKLRDRLVNNKAEWSSELQEGSADTLHVEPVFVSELAALLEQVRESFA